MAGRQMTRVLVMYRGQMNDHEVTGQVYVTGRDPNVISRRAREAIEKKYNYRMPNSLLLKWRTQ